MKHLTATLIPSALLLIAGCTEGLDVPTSKAPTSSVNQDAAKQDPVVTQATESVLEQAATGAGNLINAETVLAAALMSAKEQNKRVLVHLGAPW